MSEQESAILATPDPLRGFGDQQKLDMLNGNITGWQVELVTHQLIAESSLGVPDGFSFDDGTNPTASRDAQERLKASLLSLLGQRAAITGETVADNPLAGMEQPVRDAALTNLIARRQESLFRNQIQLAVQQSLPDNIRTPGDQQAAAVAQQQIDNCTKALNVLLSLQQ